jgi:hypothetical protein
MLASAITPALPLPTIAEKVSRSTYIVLGQVERVDYMLLSGRPREFKILDYIPTDFSKHEQEVLSIKVLEVLRWPREDLAASHLKLIHTEGSSRKYFPDRYSPGSQWVFFLRPSEGHLKSDPPEFFGAYPIFRTPYAGVWPEPLGRLPEVRRAFEEIK